MTISTGGVLLDGLGTGLGGGITDTTYTISLSIIILGNITATTNWLMRGTIRITMLYTILKNLTTVETNSLDLTMVEKDSLAITMVEDIDKLV